MKHFQGSDIFALDYCPQDIESKEIYRVLAGFHQLLLTRLNLQVPAEGGRGVLYQWGFQDQNSDHA